MLNNRCFNIIKKYINDETCSDSKAIYLFINNYIEPLVRQILYKSYEEFYNDKEIKDFATLFSKVDKEIINNLL